MYMNQGKLKKQEEEEIMINQNVVGAYTRGKSIVELEEKRM